MSKIIKKLTGKSVRLGVFVEEIVVTGSAVVDKEVYCVRWYLKGARGGKDSGDSPNQYAATDEEHDTPVVRFADVLACEVSALPHKNSAGYNEVPLEFKVVSPALAKKDDKSLGKASLDALRDVGTLTPPATVRTEQTVTLNKEGTASATLRLRIELKSKAGDDDASVADDEPATPTGTSGAQIVSTNEGQTLETTGNTGDMLSGLVSMTGSSGSSRLLVREPPSSPVTAFESSAAASDAGSREKHSRRSHRSHHRSSSSSAKKEEEAAAAAKAKKELEDALAAKTAEVEQLQARVAELEQAQQAAKEAQKSEFEDALAKAESAAADAKADAEKTRGELEKAQAELEQAQELVRQAKQETQQAQEAAEAAARSAESDEQREQRNRELDALKKQLATLQDECVKLRSAPKAGAAAGKPNVVLLAIAAVIGAVLAIILSRIF